MIQKRFLVEVFKRRKIMIILRKEMPKIRDGKKAQKDTVPDLHFRTGSSFDIELYYICHLSHFAYKNVYATMPICTLELWQMEIDSITRKIEWIRQETTKLHHSEDKSLLLGRNGLEHLQKDLPLRIAIWDIKFPLSVTWEIAELHLRKEECQVMKD